MQVVNPGLVDLTRNLPGIINNGELDPSGIVGLLFNRVEIRTALTPPISFAITPGGGPSGDSGLIAALQPTVILSGLAGRIEIAPHGVSPGGASWGPALLIGGGLAALLWWLVFGQR